MKIETNTIVVLRFTLRDKEGYVLQDTFSAAPARYLHGSSNIDVILQQQVEGLEAGSRKEVFISNATGSYFLNVLIESVRAASEEEILLGYPVEADPVCDDNCECYNDEK